jgi:hypothetical protein
MNEAKKNAPNVNIDTLEVTLSSFKIESEDDFKQAGAILKEITGRKRRWEGGDPESNWEGWDTLIKAANSVTKALRISRDNVSDRLDKIREVIEKKMSDYRAHEIEVRKRNDLQLAKSMEKLRKDTEKKAEALLLQGKTEEAELLSQQVEAFQHPPAIPAEDLTVSGIGQVQEYDIEVVDLMALVRAVASGEVPITGIVMRKTVSLFDVRTSVIKSYVQSGGENFKWPGVKVTPKTGYRVKGT